MNKRRHKIKEELIEMGIELNLSKKIDPDVLDSYFTVMQDQTIERIHTIASLPEEKYFNTLQDKVLATLQEQQSAEEVRPKGRIVKWVLTAAASVIAVIAFTLLLTNNNEQQNDSFVDELDQDELFFILEEYGQIDDISEFDVATQEEEYLEDIITNDEQLLNLLIDEY